MALEQRLTLAPPPLDNGGGGGGDEGNRAPRLPRWTRQEILVLIQGKRVTENRVRRGRTAGLAFGSGQVEPKWASVSSYCKRHGVNRGPVQCRKRWSNLAGDYKKIKEWESGIREETESFWVMRNDLRRERKLPGFFDREVYDILDGGGGSSESTVLALALAPSTATATEEEQVEIEPEPEAVFDSGRSAAAEDGLFSDFEQSGQDDPDPDKEKVKEAPSTTLPAPIPVSEKQPPTTAQPQGTTEETRSQLPNTDIQGGRKKKRSATEGEDEEERNVEKKQRLIFEAMERNGRLLGSQLEAQNSNFELDREQRKDHVNSLIAVLNKLADAMGRIADKL